MTHLDDTAQHCARSANGGSNQFLEVIAIRGTSEPDDLDIVLDLETRGVLERRPRKGTVQVGELLAELGETPLPSLERLHGVRARVRLKKGSELTATTLSFVMRPLKVMVVPQTGFQPHASWTSVQTLSQPRMGSSSWAEPFSWVLSCPADPFVRCEDAMTWSLSEELRETGKRPSRSDRGSTSPIHQLWETSSIVRSLGGV